MKRTKKFTIGYGILTAALVAVFALPMSGAVSNEANAFEIENMFNVFNIVPVQADDPKTHNIEMSAELLPDGRMGYQMNSHVIISEDDGDEEIQDVTSRYDSFASVPGPTIIIDEGDEVFVTLTNNLGVETECVSIHTHGVHYAPADDGTPIEVNGVEDSCATFTETKTYHWSAAKGSAGVWPYHDHTFGSDLGSELEGLYGTLIVNPEKMKMLKNGKEGNIKIDKIDKDFVLWMQGTTFWGMEIDYNNGGKQTPLWANPNLRAELGENVRFNVLGIGSEFHTFHIHGHKWLQDGTSNVVDVQSIQPLTRSQFVIKAGEGVGAGNWMYHCHVFAHMEAGMTGIFEVVSGGDSASTPGPSPFEGTVSFEITDEPGPWFKNRAPLAGLSESLAVASPGNTIIFDMTSTNTVHTITSLIWPVADASDPFPGNDAMPLDQSDAFKGGAQVTLEDPGLYVFTCKIHPYMFAAVIVDDGDTDGLDLGENIRIVNGITTPTHSPLAVSLLRSFFVVTDPNLWQDYTTGTWNVSLPAVDIRLTDGVVVPLSAINVSADLDLAEPQYDGIGELWVNTQFEITDGKAKFGTSTAVDTASWEVTKKISLPEINMNHPHNMWTDTDQTVIYQTQWFDNRMAVFDRATGDLIDDVQVGFSPSHVMTRPGTDNIYIAMNGDNTNESVVEVRETIPGTYSVTDKLDIGAPHPHGHWMNADTMVTPNAFSGSATAYDFDSEVATITTPDDLLLVTDLFTAGNPFGVPIATSIHPSGDKYYVANLLDQTLTCVSIGSPACVDGASLVDVKPIVLIAHLLDDPEGDDTLLSQGVITANQTGAAGLLPIQTPVSPDGKYVVTATLLPSITIVDTETDELVLSLACDAGCHGANFGANVNGGYNAYVSSKFSNALIVFDPESAINADLDENGILDSTESLGVVGRVLLSTNNLAIGAITDDIVVGFDGMGGQGVLAIPNPYDGWIEETTASTTLSPEIQGWIDELNADQTDPYS